MIAHEPALNEPLVAGVDVGGTKTSVVVTDARDRILYEQVTATDRSSLVGQIAGLVDDAQRLLRRDVAAVGVAIPGHVDPEDGSVSLAVNLGITHLPLGPMLQTELGVPIFVEHDARAAALWLSEQTADGSAQAPAQTAATAADIERQFDAAIHPAEAPASSCDEYVSTCITTLPSPARHPRPSHRCRSNARTHASRARSRAPTASRARARTSLPPRAQGRATGRRGFSGDGHGRRAARLRQS